MNTDLLQSGRKALQRLSRTWLELDLVSQFAAISVAVLFCGMVAIAAWVHYTIRTQVVQSTAKSVAPYINSAIDPLLQELSYQPELSSETRKRLEALVSRSAWRENVVATKVWSSNGVILFSDWEELIGRRFEPSASLRKAWSGQVEARLSDLDEEENELERPFGAPLLEVYTPIRTKGSERVIAVAEFYYVASDLQHDLNAVRRRSWYVLCSVAIIMLGLLVVVVKRGSLNIISRWRARASGLSEIHSRTVSTNELFLRRVGMELHDGPAQLIGLALLRLDSIRPRSNSERGRASIGEFDRIQNALREALAEIRYISAGLVLPELDGMSATDALLLAARNHERRTGTSVKCEFIGSPPKLSTPVVSCLYRFAQEALNNAFRHAGGADQTLRGNFEKGTVEVEVSDRGPGFDPNAAPNKYSLGLKGMRDRVASLGGNLEIESVQGKGTRLIVRFEPTAHGMLAYS
jgi:signal transduction histidine kinase